MTGLVEPVPALPGAAERERARRRGRGRVGALVARVPRALWLCAAVAIVHAMVWAFVTPLGQVPDETAHASYVEYIAQHGTVPSGSTDLRPRRGGVYGGGLDRLATFMPYSAEGDPSWAPAQSRALISSLREPGANDPGGVAGYVTNNPPLYYALMAVPAKLGNGLNVLDRLLILRLLTSLFCGLTVAFVFLFMRELLPRSPWAWTVGALMVAFQPLFGFIGGGVTPDPLLFAWAAALFWLVARAFRKGVDVRLGVAVGVVALGGCLTKGTMFGLLPGAGVGFLAAALRTARPQRRQALLGLAAGAVVFAGAFALWLYANTHLFSRAASTTTSGVSASHVDLAGQFSYAWQFYLPKLPGMNPWFSHFPHYPLWQVWVQGFIGRFGWHQFNFPLWVYVVGLVVLLGIAASAGRGLWLGRLALRRRLPELVAYALMLLGLLAVIVIAAYRYRVATHFNFEQARYLLPALALYAAVVAFAVRGVPARWQRSVAIGLVTLAVGHSLASLLLSLGRYYL